MLRFGKISDIDPAKCFARVTFTDDGIVSDWLQIIVMGALSTKFFHMFDINEQVACLMDEHSEEGVILGAVFNNNTQPDGGTKDKVRVKFSDDSFIEYDRASHEYNINVQGAINITASGQTTVEAATVSVAAETVDVEATTAQVSADTVSIEGTVSITGDTAIVGNLAVTGTIGATISITAPSISGGGAVMAGGNLAIPGDIGAVGEVSGGTVVAGAIDLAAHKHGGVSTGAGQTGTPV